MHSKNNNITSTLYNNANKVVNQLFESLLSSYEDNLETSVGKSLFYFWFISADVLKIS